MSSADDFDKARADAPEGFFAWEAAGLDWLRAAPGGPRVVDVRSVRRDGIVLERLHPAPATRRAAADLGAALARLHESGSPGFGVPPPGWPRPHGWIGRQELPLADAPMPWGRFYAHLRLLPWLRRARDLGRVDAAEAAIVERVCERLVAGEWDDGRPPARIHGDLWGGNVVHTAGGAVLIDPAAHGGHGETDLAMLALFGTEHLEAVQDAYAAEAALDDGWRLRVALHQLHPLLVHAVSHGPAYARAAVDAARRYA